MVYGVNILTAIVALDFPGVGSLAGAIEASPQPSH
jgi:hypothetical protein